MNKGNDMKKEEEEIIEGEPVFIEVGDEEEECDNKITRQVQMQKPSIQITLSTEDPEEKMDYLVEKIMWMFNENEK